MRLRFGGDGKSTRPIGARRFHFEAGKEAGDKEASNAAGHNEAKESKGARNTLGTAENLRGGPKEKADEIGHSKGVMEKFGDLDELVMHRLIGRNYVARFSSTVLRWDDHDLLLIPVDPDERRELIRLAGQKVASIVYSTQRFARRDDGTGTQTDSRPFEHEFRERPRLSELPTVCSVFSLADCRAELNRLGQPILLAG